MEKRNTLLLTVIAIATLLVAVVGATFAYFAQSGSFDNTANLTATTAAASSEFIATGSTISLSVLAADMTEAKIGNTVATTPAQNGDLVVEFTAGGTETLSCTYHLYYEWASDTDAYTITSQATDGKEFTYAITKKADGDSSFTAFNAPAAENQFVNSSTSGQQVIGALNTIQSAGTTKATDAYQITVKWYNLAQRQNPDNETYNKSGKTYKIKFGITDVTC